MLLSLFVHLSATSAVLIVRETLSLFSPLLEGLSPISGVALFRTLWAGHWAIDCSVNAD